ncbi:MAG: PAS domain S-box protein [Gemmatimonadetes bacterium]|nr:PAS domain S-box protein [Gemmatimonadota bacterium]NIO31988.1 PAS domain S-box protein [Gemmatimonadota bacterium]
MPKAPDRRAWTQQGLRHLLGELRAFLYVWLRRLQRRRPQRHGYRESRYRSLFDGVPIALYLSAPDGTILDANPALVELLGYPSRESLLQLNAYDLFVDHDVRRSQIAKLEQEDLVRDYPMQLRRSDGTLIWVLDQARAVRDAKGRVLFYEGSLKDITVEKQAREELQRTNETLRALIEASPLAIMALDTDRNVLTWNAAAERIFGWSEAEVVGRPLPPIVPDTELPEFRRLHGRLLQGHSLSEVEVVRRRRDGTLINVHISGGPLRDDNGEVVGSLSLIADVTERKEVEDTRKRLAEILQATPDFVGIFTVDGVGTYLNSAGRDMLGIEEDDVPSPVPAWEYHPEPDRTRMRDHVLPAAIRDGYWSGEMSFKARDGRVIPTSTVIVAHRTSDGRVDHLSAIARDLTDQKNLEERLRHAQTMEAIGRLAGGIAHDFNNLLTSIIGHCDLVLKGLIDERARTDIEEIKEAGQRAAALTSQLLAFGRRQMLQPRLIELNKLITDLGPRLRDMTGDTIHLTTVLDRGLRPVKADPVQLEEIIVSLVENAYEAMPNGGTISIETAHADLKLDSAQQLGLSQGGIFAVLSVIDRGCGMDEETLARIFEPFFSTKKEVKGTGLGLATVYGIVKQSGGDIWIKSKPNHGTAVMIYLPAVEDLVESAEPTPRAEEPITTSGTVLLVEDEPAVLSLAARVLRGRGYEVLQANDGSEALQLHQEHAGPIDILITDVVMPKLGGVELAEQLHKARPQTRVIYMSGYTDNRTVRDMMADSAVNFLQKPFSPAALAELTRQVLGGTRGMPRHDESEALESTTP